MADQCLDPTNSTDCLLRAILEANSGYNWNPVTFGFTAVFTIIAFIVSVVALFQQFIAAGPGRLKASQRAIGPRQNETRTRTHFSWREFRFQTIVKVPVLDIQKVLAHKTTAIDIKDGANLSTNDKNQKVPLPEERARVVAGWSQLIYDLSLLDVNFDTIQCLTDYLPDDVPAAPAWGRVESIVFLCIMKGCTRLSETTDGYVGAIGLFAQLSWNMHPTLGPIAVYRTWDIRETSQHSLRDVQRMIPTFLGELYFTSNPFYKPLPQRYGTIPISFDFMQVKKMSLPSWERCQHQHDHCLIRKNGLWLGYMIANANKQGGIDKRPAALAALLFADRPSTLKAFPTRMTEIHQAISTMYTEYFPWLILADDLDDNVLRSLSDTFVEFDERDAVPDLSLHEHHLLTSWLPYAAEHGSSKTDRSTSIERPTIRHADPVPSYKYNKMESEKLSYDKITNSGLRIARPAVRHLSKWLSDEQNFATANPPERKTIQQWLTYQLAEVDWFLSTMGDDLICAANNLVSLGTTKFGAIQFTKLSRRFVMPETLDAFHLDWAESLTEEGCLIVKGFLDQETVQRLFAYTKNYIEQHRNELHTVRCSRTAQGYYFATKKSSRKHKNQASPAKRQFSANDALLDSPSGDPSSKQSVAEWTNDQTSRQTTRSDRTENVSRVTSATKSEDTITQSLDGTGTASDWKPDQNLAQHIDDSELREYLSEEVRRTSGEISDGDVTADEVAVKIDREIGALEALAFFRAALYGALLANGTDTSLILGSDKRYQLVQVQ